MEEGKDDEYLETDYPSFAEYVEEFDKKYSGANEEKFRKRIYEGSVEMIGSMCNESYSPNVTALSDRTAQELAQLANSYKPRKGTKGTSRKAQ